MNICTKFQVEVFKNGIDITYNMSKTDTFHVIRYFTAIFRFFFRTDFDASKGISGLCFCVLCENLT